MFIYVILYFPILSRPDPLLGVIPILKREYSSVCDSNDVVKLVVSRYVFLYVHDREGLVHAGATTNWISYSHGRLCNASNVTYV